MEKTCMNCKNQEKMPGTDEPCGLCIGSIGAYWEPIAIAKQDAVDKTCDNCKHYDKSTQLAPCVTCDCAAWGVRDAPETPSAWEPVAITNDTQSPEHDTANQG